jgi:hypothetical protein
VMRLKQSEFIQIYLNSCVPSIFAVLCSSSLVSSAFSPMRMSKLLYGAPNSFDLGKKIFCSCNIYRKPYPSSLHFLSSFNISFSVMICFFISHLRKTLLLRAYVFLSAETTASEVSAKTPILISSLMLR